MKYFIGGLTFAKDAVFLASASQNMNESAQITVEQVFSFII